MINQNVSSRNKLAFFRLFLLVLITLTIEGARSAPAANKYGVRVGAIRWDAWYGDSWGTPRVTRALSPKQFWYRLPFFSQIENKKLQPINGNQASTMAAEIQYAAYAGIDYWIFTDYPADSGLDNALKLYLNSPSNGPVNFALSLGKWSVKQALSSTFGETWYAMTVQRLLDPRYETVYDGRPLVYVDSGVCVNDRHSESTCRKVVFERLNDEVKRRTGRDIYYVYLAGDLNANPRAHMKLLGMNAISAYSANPAGLGVEGGMSYSEFSAQILGKLNVQLKDLAHSLGIGFVPFASSGWDTQPREVCGSYCIAPGYTEELQTGKNVSSGSAKSIARHIKGAIKLALANKRKKKHNEQGQAGPKTIVVYAWNEFDKGEWLSPTRSKKTGKPNTKRIEALRQVLRN